MVCIDERNFWKWKNMQQREMKLIQEMKEMKHMYIAV